MIIWRGYGILALLIPLILSGICNSLFPEGKTFVLGWILGGIILYLWGKKLHNPEVNETILYDEKGSGYVFKKHDDSLFFIPMEYCGILWVVGAIIYLLK